jgi:hypothetical protein
MFVKETPVSLLTVVQAAIIVSISMNAERFPRLTSKSVFTEGKGASVKGDEEQLVVLLSLRPCLQTH